MGRRIFFGLCWLVIVLSWSFLGYTWWLSHQPIRDVGPCYDGMTLPARSSCTATFQMFDNRQHDWGDNR